MKLVLITGLSGAGKSVALRTLEDAGFEAIDNLPLSFLPAIAGAAEEGRPRDAKIAIVADIRARDFSAARFAEAVAALKAQAGLEFHLVYLDCDDEALQRRFTETRRRHPLAQDRPVADGIRHERGLLAGIPALADAVIDTGGMAVAELRQMMVAQFAAGARRLSLAVTSFSYRGGLPREADLVFDVRFLRNPHYAPELRALDGRDARVGDYIAADPDFPAFFARLTALLLPLLPRYAEEGKHYLTLAFGCTGGQHRSVYVAERLARTLREAGRK